MSFILLFFLDSVLSESISSCFQYVKEYAWRSSFFMFYRILFMEDLHNFDLFSKKHLMKRLILSSNLKSITSYLNLVCFKNRSIEISRAFSSSELLCSTQSFRFILNAFSTNSPMYFIQTSQCKNGLQIKNIV